MIPPRGDAVTGVPPYGGPEDDEDDWFGDGSAFDSGEDLAAALFSMAGVSAPAGAGVYPSDDDPVDDVVDPRRGPPPAPTAVQRWSELRGAPAAPAPARTAGSEWITMEPSIPAAAGAASPPPPASRSQPTSWGVREHGATQGPAGPDGRYGIRHGVRMLRMAEQSMDQLRMDAIEVAWAAAAVAVAQASAVRRGVDGN